MSLQGLFDPVARKILTRPYDELVMNMIEGKPYGIKSNSKGKVERKAFANYSTLASVDFPNVTSIGADAFANCTNLASVNLPNVTSIEETAFQACTSLASVDFPNVTSIGIGAFANCTNLASVNLPNLSNIGVSAFAHCDNLASAVFPNVTTLRDYCFMDCDNLVSIDLPSATSIGADAFAHCTTLTAIIVRTTSVVCTVDFFALNNTPIVEGKGHVYVPSSMYEYYRAGYEPALEAAGFAGFFDIMFRKIEDYPDICGAN